MDKEQKKQDEQVEKIPETAEHKQKVEKKIDQELEDTFPASDPPSFSQPGNDGIEDCN